MSSCVAAENTDIGIADDTILDNSHISIDDKNYLSSNSLSDDLDDEIDDNNLDDNLDDNLDNNLDDNLDDTSSVVKNYTFSDLETLLDDAEEGSTIVLDGNYIYNKKTDSGLEDGVMIRKSLTIDGNGHYLDGKGSVRIMRLYYDINLVLKNMVMKNGYRSECSDGAVMFLLGGNGLTIRNCSFINNKVYRASGGVMDTNGGCTIKIYNSKFINNTAIHKSNLAWTTFKSGMGSAIRTFGSALTLNNCTFTGNSAYVSTVLVVTESEGRYQQGSLYVTGCTFNNNPNTRHGVIYLDELGKGQILNSVFKNNKCNSGSTIILDTSKSAVVKNCLFEGNAGQYGGAINIQVYKDNMISNATIENCTFKKNTATEHGGAINSGHGNTKIINCKFESNSAKKWSGAIYGVVGTVTVTGCAFTSNKAYYGGGVALINVNKGQVSNSKFTKNTGTKGGTLVVDTSKAVTITNCKFTSNKGEFGGGVYVQLNKKNYKMTVTVNKCQFTKNSVSQQGGAVCVIGGTLYLKNSVLTSNTAKTYGGGVALRSGTISISGTKFVSNRADNAGAAYFVANRAIVKSCSFTKNVAAYNFPHIYSKTKTTISKCTYKSNYLLKYLQVSMSKSGSYMKVGIKSNTGKPLNKKFKLTYAGPKKYTTKWYTTKKGVLKVKIPNLKKGTYKVSITISGGKYYPVTRTIKI